MSGCRDREGYLAGLLGQTEQVAFEAHLGQCEQCAEIVTRIRRVEQAVESWIEDLPALAPTTIKAAQLVDAIRLRQATSRAHRRLWIVGATTAAVCAASLLLTVLRPWKEDDTGHVIPAVRVLLSEGGAARVTGVTGASATVQVHGAGRIVFTIGADRIGVAGDSRVDILPAALDDARLRLTHGSVTVAAKRRKAGHSLTIECDGFLVRVVGTRFMVDRGGEVALRVKVTEGEVLVVQPDGHVRMVRAGQVLAYASSARQDGTLGPFTQSDKRHIDEALALDGDRLAPASPSAVKTDAGKSSMATDARVRSPDAPFKLSERQAASGKLQPPRPLRLSASPTEQDIRGWIVDRDYSRAESALREALRVQPDAKGLLWLMGECMRKAGKASEAAEAYSKVVLLGNAVEANRARLQVAELHMGSLKAPGRAIPLLRVYLSQPEEAQPRAADAKLALAQALEKTGATAEAWRLLEEIVSRHPGTSAGLQAVHMLEGVRRSRSAHEKRSPR